MRASARLQPMRQGSIRARKSTICVRQELALDGHDPRQLRSRPERCCGPDRGRRGQATSSILPVRRLIAGTAISIAHRQSGRGSHYPSDGARRCARISVQDLPPVSTGRAARAGRPWDILGHGRVSDGDRRIEVIAGAPASVDHRKEAADCRRGAAIGRKHSDRRAPHPAQRLSDTGTIAGTRPKSGCSLKLA